METGGSLRLGFDEPLDAGSLPPIGAFGVTVDGSSIQVASLVTPGSGGLRSEELRLVFEPGIDADTLVRVTYTDPTEGDDAQAIQDASGNDARTFTLTAVHDPPVVTDTTPPDLTGNPAVEGSTLVLNYDEALDAGSTPSASAYTVRVAGAVRPVSAVSVRGATVTLTLSSAVTAGETVTLTYTVPTTNPVQDESGNDAAAIGNRSVTNNTGGDTTPPNLTGDPTVDGATLLLTYDEALDAASTPSASAYTVRVAGAMRPVSAVSVSGVAVTLTLSSAVTAGATVTLSYTVPTANPVQDESGNDAAAIGNRSVTNITRGDTTPPRLTGDPTVDGATLVLSYDEALDAGSTPSASAYTVRVAGAMRPVSAVSVSGVAVTLTLSSPVTAGATVTLSYTVPTANPVQDVAGNDAAAIGNRSVTNMTMGDTTPPRLTGTPKVDGATLVLSYDEALDEGSTPSTDAYTVIVAGAMRPVSAVSVRGETVTLTLSSPVTAGETVSLSYAVPPSNSVQDAAGNDAAGISGRSVTNETPTQQPGTGGGGGGGAANRPPGDRA